MSHLKHNINDENLSSPFVSNPPVVCIHSKKLIRHTFSDCVAFMQNCCAENAFPDSNDIQSHKDMESKSINHEIVGFLSSFHSLHSPLTTTCLMQRDVAVTPIGTSYVEHGVKETLVNIGGPSILGSAPPKY